MHMEPLYEIPFMPAYDPILPIEEADKRGVLCILYEPALGVSTVRVQRNMMDVMMKLNCVFNNTSRLEFYKLGKKLVITQDENVSIFTDVLTYNKAKYDMHAVSLICNENFTSLTESEALTILESATLHRGKNRSYYVTLEIRDD